MPDPSDLDAVHEAEMEERDYIDALLRGEDPDEHDIDWVREIPQK